MTPPDADEDYKVGYGKPPKNTRFAKGRSGNPRGRPKGALGMRAIVQAEMNELMTVREGGNGRPRKLPKGQVLVKQTMIDAIKGKPRSLSSMLALIAAYGDLDGPVDQKATSLDDYDAEMFALYLESLKPEPSDVD